MNDKSKNKIKLGAFVLIGTILLLLGLYFIGSKKNIFNSTIKVSANFSNVGGLMSGNNVRFNGINVGTVSKVYAISDTVITVEFSIAESSTSFIGKNAIASVGTDGMLGSKLINIEPGKGSFQSVAEGDVLAATNPIQMDNVMRSLTNSNNNVEVITGNLKTLSEKLNEKGSLVYLLSDTVMASDVKKAVVYFKMTGNNSAVLTGNLNQIVQDIKSGKGSLGTLITDTMLSHRLNATMVNLKAVSDTMILISGDFKHISAKIKNGEGGIGLLINDTTFARNLNQSMINIKDGSANFNEDLKGLQHTWPLKKYFRKKAAEKK